jgi:hypothetical protein
MMLGNLIHSIRLMLLVFTLPVSPIVVAGTVLNFDFFLKINIIFSVLNCFYVLILKIILKNKKTYHFNILLNKKTL